MPGAPGERDDAQYRFLLRATMEELQTVFDLLVTGDDAFDFGATDSEDEAGTKAKPKPKPKPKSKAPLGWRPKTGRAGDGVSEG